MQVPARFPRDLADAAAFADWAVYGDYLQTIGDPRGAIVAAELALPAEPSDAQALAFSHACNPVVEVRSYRYMGVELGHALGHVRTIAMDGMQQFSWPRVERTLVEQMAALLAAPAAHLIEELRVRYDGAHDEVWAPLFARIPAGCRLAIHFATELADLDRVREWIPRHVRELVVWFRPGAFTSGGDAEEHALVRFVDDRFADVELVSGTWGQHSPRAAIVAQLARTSHVRLHLPSIAHVPAADPATLARIRIGWPGDAAFAGRRWFAVPCGSRVELLHRSPTMGVRAQLARCGTETFMFAAPDTSRPQRGVQLERRRGAWTFHNFGLEPVLLPIAIDGVLVPDATSAPLADGARLTLRGGQQEYRFVADAQTVEVR